MVEQLTAETCVRLSDPACHSVLVSTPVLRVVEVSDANLPLYDFVVNRIATVTDGQTNVQVALPVSLRVWASGTGEQPQTVGSNDVIKVQRMLRLPHDDTNIILVHDVEICSDEEVPLQIANYEDTIAGLQADLAKTEAALKMVLQDQGAGITPSFVESVMRIITTINETIEKAIPE